MISMQSQNRAPLAGASIPDDFFVMSALMPGAAARILHDFYGNDCHIVSFLLTISYGGAPEEALRHGTGRFLRMF